MGRHSLGMRVILAVAAIGVGAGPAAAQGDVTPPGDITNLTVTWIEGTDGNFDGWPDYYTADLTWTSPGDDGQTAGTSVTSYEFKWLDTPIDEGNWNSSGPLNPDPFTILPAPQSMTVHMEYSWIPGALYYFAVKAYDEVDNPSPIAQVVNTVPAPPPPGDSGSSRNGCGGPVPGAGAVGVVPLSLALLTLRRR